MQVNKFNMFVASTLALMTCAGADGARKLSIMAVMHKQYTVSKAPYVVVKKQLKSDSIDWKIVEAASEKYLALSRALGENQPRRGDDSSWKRLVGIDAANGRALGAAVKARDLKALRAAERRIAESCDTCHDAHKYRDEN